MPDCYLIWDLRSDERDVRCQMVTCCSGAELQLVENGEIVLRELYPDKSDLYERARQLKVERGEL
jgi:hypothetical protein